MADEIQRAFDLVYANGPSTNPTQPDKGQIRSVVGRTIQDQVDAVRLIADAAVLQKNAKEPVRTNAVSNVSVASGLVDGASVGGVTLATGDRVLLTAQTVPAQNGVYITVASGAASRASDLDSSSEFPGASIYVLDGVRKGYTYICVPATTPVVVGTTALQFVLIDTAAQPTVPQTIGVAGTPIDGSAVSSDQTVVLGQQILADGFLKTFRIYAHNAGELRIRRFTKSGDTFTAVSGDLSVRVTEGANTLSVSAGTLPFFEVRSGEYIGIYSRKSVYTYNAEASSGWWSPASNADVREFTDSTLTTSLRLEAGFDIEETTDAVQNQKLLTLAGVLDRGTQNVGLGKGITPTESASSVTPNTIIFRNPVRANGVVESIRAFIIAEGNIFVRRFSKSSDTFTQVGPDYEVVFPTTGVVELSGDQIPYIPAMSGEYLGFFRNTALIAYLTATPGADSYADPYYSGSPAGNYSAFTDATATAIFPLQIGFEVALGDIKRLDAKIDKVSTVSNEGDDTAFIEDTITVCEVAVNGLEVTVNAILMREGVPNVISEAVNITPATENYVRYDLVYLDNTDLTLKVVEGTQRTTDPTAFVPALDDPRGIPLYLARATNLSASTTPLWRIRDGIDRLVADEVDLHMQRARRLLPKTMSKVRRRQTLRILGFGDSITAIQAEPPSSSTPNGQYRDRAAANGTTSTYLRIKYGDDVVDALPLYTSVQLGRSDDGAGAVHSRIGWNWGLVKKLEGAGYVLGTDLFYDNMGIGGADSGDAVSGVTPTTWLTSAAALTADVVVLALGMNEFGDETAIDRYVIIAETFKASGKEVIFLDVPRRRSSTTAEWQKQNRAIRRAAEYTKCAHISFSAISDDRFFGSMGIDLADRCQANGNNHPGIAELEVYGAMLGRLFLD